MKKLLLTSLFLLAFGRDVSAQTVDPCATIAPGTTFVVSTTAPPKVHWVMDATVPANPPSDMTLVAQRLDGFYVQINANLPKYDTGKLTPSTCPAGTANAGKWAFTFTLPTNLTAGNYTATVNGYNFVLNADGTPTTTRQEGVATTIPFTAVNPVHIGPPLAPKNGAVSR